MKKILLIVILPLILLAIFSNNIFARTQTQDLVCMAIGCPNPPNVYPPPPCSYVDKNGKIKNPCLEREIRELENKINQQQKVIRQQAYEEMIAVRKYILIVRNKNSTNRQIINAHLFAKKQKSERIFAQQTLNKLQIEKLNIQQKLN